MDTIFERTGVSGGDVVSTADILSAVTAAPLRYTNGATQTFREDGATEYIEFGVPASGTWKVDSNGRFSSFWPPAYTASYDLRWIVKNDLISGLVFIDAVTGLRSEGMFERQ